MRAVSLLSVLFLLPLGFFAPATARAAQVTEVLDAADEDLKDPYDARLFTSFRLNYKSTRLTREQCLDAAGNICGASPAEPFFVHEVKELDHAFSSYQLLVSGATGLYKDLELHFTLPIELKETQKIQLSPGVQTRDSTGAGYSRLVADGVFADGDIPAQSTRSGVGDLSVGLAWAPFNDERDDTKAAWVLGFDATFPTGARKRIPAHNGNGIGKKDIELAFSTALSKRVHKFLDPYIGVHFTLPMVLGNAFKNVRCSPEAGQASVQNPCNPDNMETEEIAYNPGLRGGMFMGTEFIPWEVPRDHQKFVIDFRVIGDYIAEGRDYTEISDFLKAPHTYVPAKYQAEHVGELTFREQYARLGGLLGFYVQLSRYILFKTTIELAYNTEHFLTNEKIGSDLPNAGQPGLVDTPEEENPDYNALVDQVGKRLRAEQTLDFTWMLTGVILIEPGHDSTELPDLIPPQPAPSPYGVPPPMYPSPPPPPMYIPPPM